MLRTNGFTTGLATFSDGFEANPRRFDRAYGAPSTTQRGPKKKAPARRHSAGRLPAAPAKASEAIHADWLDASISPKSTTLDARVKDVRARLMPIVTEAAARVAARSGADILTTARAIERHLADASRALDLPALGLTPENFRGFLFRGLRSGDEVARVGRGRTGNLQGWAAEMAQKLAIFEVLAERAGRPDTETVNAFVASIDARRRS